MTIWSFSLIPDALRVEAWSSDWYGNTTTWERERKTECTGLYTSESVLHQVCVYLCCWYGHPRAVVRTRVCLPAVLQELLHVSHLHQHLVPHRHQTFKTREGTRRFGNTTSTFRLSVRCLFSFLCRWRSDVILIWLCYHWVIEISKVWTGRLWWCFWPCLFFCISKQRSFIIWTLPSRTTSGLMHRF